MTEKTGCRQLEHRFRCGEEGLRLLADNVADHAVDMFDTPAYVSNLSGTTRQMMGAAPKASPAGTSAPQPGTDDAELFVWTQAPIPDI